MQMKHIMALFVIVLAVMPLILYQTRYVYDPGSSPVPMKAYAWGNDYYTSNAFYSHPAYTAPPGNPYNYIWFHDDTSSYFWNNQNR